MPVFLSIGYAACHWCHVMAHESFEHEQTAGYLNSHFVSIKVDREERPDIDAVYMEATQAMTGHGGWPMTCILTPTGEPFFAGTYFPVEARHGMPAFGQVLRAVVKAWQERRDEVTAIGADIAKHLQRDQMIAASDDRRRLGHRRGGAGSQLRQGIRRLWRRAEVPALDGVRVPACVEPPARRTPAR